MIKINIDKAKEIGHQIRREKRAEEFKPLDEAIAKQLPGQVEGAEASRQVIRDKYALIQQEIDQAQTPEDIKASLGLGGV